MLNLLYRCRAPLDPLTVYSRIKVIRVNAAATPVCEGGDELTSVSTNYVSLFLGRHPGNIPESAR